MSAEAGVFGSIRKVVDAGKGRFEEDLPTWNRYLVPEDWSLIHLLCR